MWNDLISSYLLTPADFRPNFIRHDSPRSYLKQAVVDWVGVDVGVFRMPETTALEVFDSRDMGDR